MPRGGKRDGAGRPKNQQSGTIYDSAEDYLIAVACGQEPADALRIMAAKAILPYQKGRQRAPVPSAAPKASKVSVTLSQERQAQEEWRAKSEEVRRKHGG